MSVQEIVKRGKLTPKGVARVLKIIDKYMFILKYAYLDAKNSRTYWEQAKEYYEHEDCDESDTDNLYYLAIKISAAKKELFYIYAKDVFEFFYVNYREKADEYYYHQFPLDRKRYEKERVPIARLKPLLDNKNYLDEEFVNLIEETAAVFHKCLKK